MLLVTVLLQVVMVGMVSLKKYGVWYEVGGIVVVIFRIMNIGLWGCFRNLSMFFLFCCLIVFALLFVLRPGMMEYV